MNKYINSLANIRLNSDAAASAGEPDPLAMPTGDVDISRPIIPAANYEMEVTSATVADNKDKTGKNLVLKLKNTRAVRSTKGDELPPGQVVLTQYVSLTVTDKRTSKNIAQDIARTSRGLGLPPQVTGRDIINNPSVLNGKTGLFKIKVSQETAEYAEGNQVGGIVVEG